MKEMISYCGLACHECGAYIATVNNDEKKRREVAELWSKEYHVTLRPEDIACAGCVVLEGPHIGHCFECAIRKCGIAKGVITCAHCTDYGCKTIAAFLAQVPQAKERLESLRKNF